MSQIGVLSLSQLQLHDHYDWNSGGPVLGVARVASANLRISSPDPVDSAVGVGTWKMMKRIIINQDSPGGMTVMYTMERVGGAGTVHGQTRLYRGTTLHLSGVDNSTAAGPTDYTDAAFNHDIEEGDQVEIWGYVSAGAAAICRIDGMELHYDATIVSIAGWDITVGLSLTGSGLDYTVVF